MMLFAGCVVHSQHQRKHMLYFVTIKIPGYKQMKIKAFKIFLVCDHPKITVSNLQILLIFILRSYRDL